MKTLPLILAIMSCAQLGVYSAEPGPLPSPAEFTLSKYLGTWFEVARLPTVMQPEGSLATAEYSTGDQEGVVIVKNTAYDAQGHILSAVEGTARLAQGGKKGRLRVSFGPVIPEEPNYCVLRVDKGYRIAVVGSPDRKSLWILSRKIPVPEKRLQRLAKVAEKSGYDTTRLVVAKWPEQVADAGTGKGTATKPGLSGRWTLHMDGPNGEQVNLPMELQVDGKKLTGKIGRNEGRWLEIHEGKVDGNTFRFTVVRDRPNGGSMKYEMAGRFAEGKLTGTARTAIEGRGEVTAEWDADPQPRGP